MRSVPHQLKTSEDTMEMANRLTCDTASEPADPDYKTTRGAERNNAKARCRVFRTPGASQIVSIDFTAQADVAHNTALRGSVTSPSATAALENTSGRPAAGERALLRAVLQDAVLCLRGCVGSGRERERLITQAILWVTSTSRKWPFAFESLCDTLGFDVECLRRRLLCDAAQPNKSAGAKGKTQARTKDKVVRALHRLRLRGNETTRQLRRRAARRRARVKPRLPNRVRS
jgi:hypothetical protein